MKNILNKSIILAILLIWLVPAFSRAAEISFDAPKNIFDSNEEFLVKVYLDGKGVSLNAIEGLIRFPSDLLELKEIRDGNSAVNFWIEKPHSIDSNSIAFSGITAAGFPVSRNFIFGIVFRAKNLGSGALVFNSMQALQNDGLGTKTDISGQSLNFSISEEKSATKSANLAVKDNEPPESFIPSIGNDPTIFNGNYFLVFSTQDKGSGIDHYEVKEGYFGRYNIAESPYLLNDQALDNRIYVKAVDKNGNEIVMTVNARHLAWWCQCLIIVIIILICALIYKRTWLNSLKK
jgi:hypothetical protein